jgi:hypothetical protein
MRVTGEGLVGLIDPVPILIASVPVVAPGLPVIADGQGDDPWRPDIRVQDLGGPVLQLLCRQALSAVGVSVRFVSCEGAVLVSWCSTRRFPGRGQIDNSPGDNVLL